MNLLTNTLIMCMFLISAGNDPNHSSKILWNDESPSAVGENVKEGELLKKEIPDFDKDFRLQLEWKGGKKCVDTNDAIKKDISLTKKIFSDVFKPEIIPNELTEDKFLFLPIVAFQDKESDALETRFKKGEYVIQVMKTKSEIFITVRNVSNKSLDLKQLAENIFNNKILPEKWETPFYMGNLKRESKILRSGMWTAKDTFKIDSSGNIVNLDMESGLPIVDGPIGEGRYRSIAFYTNEKFFIFKIIGGPKIFEKITP
jgi:hypothetical protein